MSSPHQKEAAQHECAVPYANDGEVGGAFLKALCVIGPPCFGLFWWSTFQNSIHLPSFQVLAHSGSFVW